MNLGESIYSDLQKNEYLNELFCQILLVYSDYVFGRNHNLKDINLSDLLRFADLLSKSVDKKNRDKHKNLSQELISLLLTLYPEDIRVRYVAGSVLSNINNLKGLSVLSRMNNSDNLCSLQYPTYESADPLERVYDSYVKQILKIPHEEDYFYFKSQKEVIDNFKLNYFSYSGPTSMGKSFIMRSFIKNNMLLGMNENYAIVVPTKALINEVSGKLIKELNENLIERNYKVITSPGSLALKRKHNFILVFTPERLSYLLLDRPNFQMDYLFIDEAQKISSKDGRSPFYYKLIDIITKNSPNAKIFFSSPNIPNPSVYLNLIQGAEQKPEFSKSYKYTPVNQVKFLIDLSCNKYFIYNDLNDKLLEMNVAPNEQLINLTTLINKVGKNKQNIIYCGSTRKAVSSAVDYANSLKSKITDKRLSDLIKEISSDIHVDYYLLDVLEKGVAYHIGYLPSNIREQIELLYKDGVLKTIFCTSTLVEGVNLPADNLFITSYKNGRSNLTVVEFKNLVGRVGRIEYNLYGNVFLTALDTQTLTEKFKELLEKEIPDQSLSIVSELKPKYKQYIVEQLLKGNIALDKQETQTVNEYKLMRKFAIILLKDIIADNDSYVKSQFAIYLEQPIINKIKDCFAKNKDMDDDINVSVDQTESLIVAIKQGLSYPTTFDYNELMTFLKKLSTIFKWKKYEQDTIGNPNALGFYAVILNQWVQGYGLGQIIQKAIKYKKLNPIEALFIDFKKVGYTDSKEHKNVIITDTLNAIEQVVLFQFSNYFLKFSLQYKKIHTIDNIQNDWYEYIEYGTNNPTTIFLQKHEVSRETATYIKQYHHEYLTQVNNELKIKNTIFKCGKESIAYELSQVKFNMPELFI